MEYLRPKNVVPNINNDLHYLFRRNVGEMAHLDLLDKFASKLICLIKLIKLNF